MGLIVCLSVSIGIFICGIFCSFLFGSARNKSKSFFNTINILVIGTFISAVVMFFPIYNEIFLSDQLRCIKVFLLSIHNSIRLFIIDGEFTIVLDFLANVDNQTATVYSVYAAVIFVVAPVLTFSVVLSFFKNISAYSRYFLGYFKSICIFSELNHKSLALAESVKHNGKQRLIVFTDVFENNEEPTYELIQRAHDIGAVCFKQDIVNINFRHHHKRSKLSFFIIGGDESENMDQCLKLISEYKDRDNTNLYVFSTSIDSELLLASSDKGSVKVRRINDIRSLVNRVLYDKGMTIFESAYPDGDDKQISAVVVGLGQFGICMVKALSWFCQMDGYKIRIDAFDQNHEAASRFAAQCPELMSPKYNGAKIPGDAYYEINIHSGLNTDASEFAEKIRSLGRATYVFVALGDDAANIKTAAYLRMLFEQMGCKPIIQAVVFNEAKKEALQGIKNYRGQPYDLEFIGDLKTSYSEEVIINSELERIALDRHLQWGKEEDFWKYEYNYRSSIASAMHKKMKVLCKMPGIDKAAKDRSDDELWALRRLEHRRWNAYMRSEGYCRGPERNDLAKMHHCLVPFDELSEADQKKDDD